MRQGHTKGAAGAAKECAERRGGIIGVSGGGLAGGCSLRVAAEHLSAIAGHRRQGPLPALRLGARPGARAGGVRGGWQQGPGVGQMHAAATKRLAVNKTRPSVSGVVF